MELGKLSSASTDSIRFWVIEWVEISAYCSVNIFAMLSVYRGIQSTKRNSYRTLELLSIYMVYCVVLSFIFWIIFPNQMNISNLINGIFQFLKVDIGIFIVIYCWHYYSYI